MQPAYLLRSKSSRLSPEEIKLIASQEFKNAKFPSLASIQSLQMLAPLWTLLASTTSSKTYSLAQQKVIYYNLNLNPRLCCRNHN